MSTETPPLTDERAAGGGDMARDGSSTERSSLVDGKNISRAGEPPESTQSTLSEHGDLGKTGDDADGRGRFDCRAVYSNMEMEAEDGEIAQFRCGSWRCYCCAHRMRMNFIEEVERITAERPELRRFLTLTLDPENAPRNREEKHRYLTERWNALRTELTDRYPGLSYLWVREEGDGGNPHLHLLVDRYLPQDELSDLATRVGMGEVVDIRQVSPRNVARYLTKYLVKGSMAEIPKGARRYGSSQDLDLDVRGGGGSERDWDLLMDDWNVVDRDGPLRRPVTRTDLAQQRAWGGPVPPD